MNSICIFPCSQSQITNKFFWCSITRKFQRSFHVKQMRKYEKQTSTKSAWCYQRTSAKKWKDIICDACHILQSVLLTCWHPTELILSTSAILFHFPPKKKAVRYLITCWGNEASRLCCLLKQKSNLEKFHWLIKINK